MKKKLLMTAVVAALGGVGSAQAVHVNSDGLGQVLIYPYYTVQNGFESYINLVNTTNQVKAVKVRFLEGKNSQEVLDFNLYLSPNDEWSGKITTSASGGAKLVSNDTSCIAPTQIPVDGQDFRDLLYKADSVNSIARTREGYVEVIEMGVLTNAADKAAATHVGGSATVIATPANCGLIRDNAKTGGKFNTGSANDVDRPTGGLYGFVTLINPTSGQKATVDAVAIDNFFEGLTAADDLHAPPGTTAPTLQAVDTDAEIIDGNSILTFTSTKAIDNISAILTRSAVYNDYAIDAGRFSLTDWVLTFPTKRFYVNLPSVSSAPFSRMWSSSTSSSCDSISLTYYDREERQHLVTSSEDFSPKPDPVVTTNSLCNEVNTLSIRRFANNESKNLFDAQFTNATFSVEDAGFQYGWLKLGFANVLRGTISEGAAVLPQNALIGLPVVGFAALGNKWGNKVVDGVNVTSNYLGTTNHKYVRTLGTVTP